MDRDNELAANLSLEQEKQFIESVSRWVDKGYLPANEYKKVVIATIPMSSYLSEDLDFASKLDRSPNFIEKLMADGKTQAGKFLDNW